MNNLILNAKKEATIEKGDNTNIIISKCNKKVVAVIPAYNEAKYIFDVVLKTKKFVDLVIVIDDASKDNTFQEAKKAGAIVIRHDLNLHKGAALKTGCLAAIDLAAESIITLDADGQHDPNEIPKFLEALEKYDFVVGARDFNSDMPVTMKVGNIFFRNFSKLLFHSPSTDTQSGYRAFNTKIYSKINWESSDYGVETEVLKKIVDNNIIYGEVKIKTIYNDNYKGTTPIDGLKIAYNMIKWRLKK